MLEFDGEFSREEAERRARAETGYPLSELSVIERRMGAELNFSAVVLGLKAGADAASLFRKFAVLSAGRADG